MVTVLMIRRMAVVGGEQGAACRRNFEPVYRRPLGLGESANASENEAVIARLFSKK